jgi:hypothetical protein
VSARRGEGYDLSIDAGVAQDLLAVVDVAVAANGNIVVAGIVQSGIAGVVMGDPDCAGSLFNGLYVFGWVVMVMEVDDRHPCSSLLLLA